MEQKISKNTVFYDRDIKCSTPKNTKMIGDDICQNSILTIEASQEVYSEPSSQMQSPQKKIKVRIQKILYYFYIIFHIIRFVSFARNMAKQKRLYIQVKILEKHLFYIKIIEMQKKLEII